ncbi:MAG: hypothetical protein WBA29_11810 [Xanthobacteraceae bacterium]
MRIIAAATIAALAAIGTTGGVLADTVPPFKGNDTGGIISTTLNGQTDVRAMAAAHCAQYGKVVKWLSFRHRYGDYSSFACRWTRYGSYERPLRVRY